MHNSNHHATTVVTPGADATTVRYNLDPINHPTHYRGVTGIECIDAIQSALSPEEFKGYLRGCAMKYQWRLTRKHNDPTSDLAKAQWYLNKLNEVLSSKPTTSNSSPDLDSMSLDALSKPLLTYEIESGSDNELDSNYDSNHDPNHKQSTLELFPYNREYGGVVPTYEEWVMHLHYAILPLYFMSLGLLHTSPKFLCDFEFETNDVRNFIANHETFCKFRDINKRIDTAFRVLSGGKGNRSPILLRKQRYKLSPTPEYAMALIEQRIQRHALYAHLYP